MTPEQQARLDELRRKAEAATVPPEQVSTPVNPAAPQATMTPEQQARLDELRRKRQPGLGPAVASEAGLAAVESTGAVAGALVGGKLGAMAGSPLGPVGATVGGGLGFITGGLSGMLAGSMASAPVRDILAEKGYAFASIQSAPQTMRPYLYGAESFGASIPAIGGLNIAAQTGMRLVPSRVGGVLNRMLDTIKARPVVSTAIEVNAAATAAAARTGAAFVTEDPWALLAAELAGGVAGSVALPVRAVDYAYRGMNSIVKRFYGGAQETEAGRIINETFSRHGEDPAATMAAFEDYLTRRTAGEDLPPAALEIQSPAYRAMTNYLRTQDPEAAGRLTTATEKFFETQGRIVDFLRESGNPKDLLVAARIEQNMLEGYIESVMGNAEQAAADSVARLPKITGGSREDLSRALTQSLLDANDRVKAAERALWGAVPRDLETRPEILLEGLDALGGRYIPELRDQASPALKQFIARVRGQAPDGAEDLLAGIPGADDPALREFLGGLTGEVGEAPKLWELQQMRSLVLDLQTAALQGDAPNRQLASYYGDVSDLLLTQIQAALPEGVDTAYDAARAFTKAYHDAFTRSFAGDVAVTTRDGSARLSPELLIRRATAGGPEATALRFQEMEDAIAFLPGQGLDDPQNVTALLDMQQRVMRSLAAESLMPDGSLNPTKMTEFVRKYDATLSRFPELKGDIERAVADENFRRTMADGFSEVNAAREKTQTLGRFYGVDNPITAISGALSDARQPVTNFRELARTAREAGDATYGNAFLSTVVQWATGDGTNDLTTTLRQLTRPIAGKPGNASPLQVMLDEGIIDPDTAGRVQTVLARVERATAAAADRRLAAGIEGPESLLDALIERQIRVVGAQAGQMLRHGGAGGAGVSLQAAQQGANLFSKVFNSTPQAKVRELVLRAIEDPELMVRLMKKGTSPAEQLAAVKGALGYILPAFGNAVSGPDGIQLDFGSEEE